MRQLSSIFVSLLLVAIGGYIVVHKKLQKQNIEKKIEKIDIIYKDDPCGQEGRFFAEKGILPPVTIDLTQKEHKGIVLYHGKDQIYHPSAWERFGYFSTYEIDSKGNLYLIPMPFISIEPQTFELLTNVYRIDTNTGELSIFMHFDDIHPSSTNPYGLNAITYDCSDDTFWVAAIDESDYQAEKGVIYHIEPKTKKILSKLEGWDALSLEIVETDKGKFLFFGSARDSGLYAAKITKKHLSKPEKLFSMPSPEEHIKKITVSEINTLEIKTLPFTYTLITESSNKDGKYYSVLYDEIADRWSIVKK